MLDYAEPVTKLIDEFKRLPGIGHKSAQRLAFHLLKASQEEADRLMSAIEDAYGVWNRRISTASLNRWFEQAVQNNPPPAVSGRRLRLNYITQAKSRPPSFVIFCTRADAVPEAYLRYLTNSMRETFAMPGTPIRLWVRGGKNPYAAKTD